MKYGQVVFLDGEKPAILTKWNNKTAKAITETKGIIQEVIIPRNKIVEITNDFFTYFGSLYPTFDKNLANREEIQKVLDKAKEFLNFWKSYKPEIREKLPRDFSYADRLFSTIYTVFQENDEIKVALFSRKAQKFMIFNLQEFEKLIDFLTEIRLEGERL